MKIEDELKHQFFTPQQRAGTNIIFTANWLLNKIAILLKPTGLSLQQFNVLSILNGQPDHTATVNLIKDRLIDRMPNVSRLLNKLMEKGLVKKERNLSDQRVVYITLTPAGEKLRIMGREILNNNTFNIKEDEANLLNEILEQIRK
jgi:DNA-binding MarR family transcriptional regulator